MYFFSALHYAARSNNLEICKILVKNGADLNAQTCGGSTALHRAALMGNDELLKYFLGNPLCKNINLFLTDQDGKNLLHKAAQNGHLSSVKIIVEMGCPELKNQIDNKGNLAVDLVPDCKNKSEICSILSTN